MNAPILLAPEDARAWLDEHEPSQPVGVAVGCFDLLHVGHLRMLQAAREAGYFVLVALNSDESIRALKGPMRPMVPLTERAELVAGLSAVDLVTSFDATEASGLLRILQPRALLKGTDRTPETVPEHDLMLELGGSVLFLGDPKQHASSDLAARLHEEADRGRPD